jgi:hypothetical protein
MIPQVIRLLSVFLVASVAAVAEPSVDEVGARFEELLAARGSFSESETSFYSDQALIDHYELQSNGFLKENHLSGKQYKHILNKIRPLAKRRNDLWDYLDLTFTKVDDQVWIAGKRYSHLRMQRFPYEIRFQRDEGGDWMVVYEVLHSTPIIP